MKKQYRVDHPQLHLSVDGKLTHIARGTSLAMTEEQAKGYVKRGFVTPLDGETVDVADGADEREALKARAAELSLEGSNRWGAERLKEEIAKAEAEIAAGNSL
jgi:hypothetical protein